MSDANLVIQITGNSKQFDKEMEALKLKAKLVSKEITKDEYDRQKLSLDRQGILEKKTIASYDKIRKAAFLATAAFVAGATLSLKEFMKFEDALIGVQKTTDITGQELIKFKNSIKDLSVELGQQQASLLGIAEAAGQLGVRGAEDLTRFTKTIAMMNVASKTLQGEEAAQSLARILTVTGEGFSNVDRFASVILRLGDNFATTEAEIAFMTLSISQAGGVFKASATDAAALAASFSQLGIQPEIARSTLLKFGVEMEQVLSKGGKSLEALISITGQTEEQLKKSFKDSPVDFFQTFLQGLDRVTKGGASASEVLKLFALDNIRTLPTLTTAARANEEVARALSLARQEYKDNTKANEEFKKRTEASSFTLEQAKVKATNLAIEMGETLAPAFGVVLTVLEHSINGFKIFVDSLIGAFNWIKKVGDALGELGNKLEDYRQKARSALGLSTDKDDAEAIFRDVKKQHAENERLLAEHLANKKAMIDEASVEDIQQVTETGTAKIEAQKEENEKEIALGEERQSVLDEILAEQRAKEVDDDEKKREEKLAREEERFQQDIENIEDRLAKINDQYKTYEGFDVVRDLERLKRKAKNAKQEEIIDNLIVKAKKEAAINQVKNEISALSDLVSQKTAIGKALFALDKAIKIADTITNTHTMISNALADFPYPYNIAVAALMGAKGAAEVASISSTAIQGVSAQQGGVVGGGFGGGDRVPAMLERGEIVVPQKFNPLSPNFEETFGGLGGGGNVNVVIGFEEDASRFLTVKQREDSKLGIQS